MAVARQYYSTQAAARQTTTAADTSPATLASLVFTPDANANYYLLCLFSSDGSTTASAFHYVLNDGGTKLTEISYRPWSTSDVVPWTLLGVVASSATPVSHTIALTAGVAGGAATAGARDVTIVAIRADPQDRSVVGPGAASASTTYAAYATLSWTPATAGTYVILAQSQFSVTGSTTGGKIRLFDGVTAYGELTTVDQAAAGDLHGFQTVVLTGSLSGAQTWTLQSAVTSTAFTISCWQPVILALRVDQLPNVFGTRSTTAGTTTATSFTTFATTTPTLPSAPYLMLWSFVGGRQGPIKFQPARGGANASPSGAVYQRSGTGATTRDWSQTAGAVVYVPPGASALASQYGSVVSAATSGLDESSVVAIQLGLTPRGPRPSLTNSPAAGFVAAYTPGA